MFHSMQYGGHHQLSKYEIKQSVDEKDKLVNQNLGEQNNTYKLYNKFRKSTYWVLFQLAQQKKLI